MVVIALNFCSHLQPITACISSVEDHGYLLTFGAPGISGFLQHQNCKECSFLIKVSFSERASVTLSLLLACSYSGHHVCYWMLT